MSKLIDLKTWADRRFEEGPPIRTVQYWAQNGFIPGAKKIGRKWFVDPEIEKNSTGNELVDSVLNGTA